ncbi:diptericin A-like [Eupeodes corollae]|uniref:diptericin A-like n=1 Tax=Eupeodes corollae TaxID=290404 RepID=UPI002493AA16|nr:diptericin A-like [Eupeodes corollae]
MSGQITISFFLCLGFVVALALAYPTEEFSNFDDNLNQEFEDTTRQTLNLHRARRQFNMDGTTIAGSRGQGFDINANTRFPIWSSSNGRNSFDGTAGYSQHVGGPYGNSRPDYRGGVIFTHRF